MTRIVWISVLALTAALLTAAWPRATAETPAARPVTIGATPPGGKMFDAEITADGTIHLLYSKNGATFYTTSTDGGKTLGKAIPVVNGKVSVPGLEFDGWGMSVTDKGKVFVVLGNNAWKLKLPKDQWGAYSAVLPPGATTFEPTRPLNGVPSEGFSIVAGNDDTVTATWLSDKLYWKQSKDGGKTFSANAEVDTSYDPCNCCTTSTAIGKDGTLAILYREETLNRRDLHVILEKDGKHTRTRISKTLWELNGCPMTYYRISPAGDGFVAAWPTRGEIYFTRLDNTGKIWEPGEIKVGGKNGMRSSIFALAGADNTTLVAWKNEDKLHWRIYDSAGKPLGEESEAPGPGTQSGGVVDKEGHYILFP